MFACRTCGAQSTIEYFPDDSGPTCRACFWDAVGEHDDYCDDPERPKRVRKTMPPVSMGIQTPTLVVVAASITCSQCGESGTDSRLWLCGDGLLCDHCLSQ